WPRSRPVHRGAAPRARAGRTGDDRPGAMAATRSPRRPRGAEGASGWRRMRDDDLRTAADPRVSPRGRRPEGRRGARPAPAGRLEPGPRHPAPPAGEVAGRGRRPASPAPESDAARRRPGRPPEVWGPADEAGRTAWWGFPPPARKLPPPEHGVRVRRFGESWWSERWIAALERLGGGYAARLRRGRSYARQGRVHDLAVRGGVVQARVTGSRPEP